MADTTLVKVRIDKWLWAARFFKTRSLAKQAIEGGKIHIDGRRVKPSKELEVGAKLVVRQGFEEKEVIVVSLADQRGPASFAATLYTETEASTAKRALRAEERKAMAGSQLRTPTKPNTRQRRHIHRFKRELD